jgi:hypothetical protein
MRRSFVAPSQAAAARIGRDVFETKENRPAAAFLV